MHQIQGEAIKFFKERNITSPPNECHNIAFQEGKCYCLSEIHSPQLSNRDCSTPCPGDNSQMCGGKGTMSVFNIKNDTGI